MGQTSVNLFGRRTGNNVLSPPEDNVKSSDYTAIKDFFLKNKMKPDSERASQRIYLLAVKRPEYGALG